MAQITNVTSESLQAQIRRLLPSQQGFGEDLQASNVITPIIDLTASAEGSQLGTNLQTAINYTGATVFNSINTSANTIINTAGFYRITGNALVLEGTGGNRSAQLILTDGVTPKIIWAVVSFNTSYEASYLDSFDYVIFVKSGEEIQTTTTTFARMVGNVRQIADVNGNLVNPSGFNFE